MTRNGVCERILFLRRRIAAIEARGGGFVSAANRKGPASFAETSAQNPFELLLQNLPPGSLSEAVPARPRDAAAAAGFTCALALRASAGRPRSSAVWISEDMAAREIGLPYGRGLEAMGLDPARLIFVRTRGPAESLWAMEEALKSRAAAIVAESWITPRAYDLSASRRLALAARRGGGFGLLLLLRACGEAARLTSAAQLRFEIAAQPPLSAQTSGRRAQSLETPGPPGWRLRIAKARAGLPGIGDVDPLVWRDISFDSEKAVFHAFSERVPAPAADRPDFTPARAGRG